MSSSSPTPSTDPLSGSGAPGRGRAETSDDPDAEPAAATVAAAAREGAAEVVHVGWDGVRIDTLTEHVRVDFVGLARASREIRKRQR